MFNTKKYMEIQKKKSRVEHILNSLLSPLAYGYKFARKMARRTHDSAPLIYGQVESLIRSQIVSLEKDKKLLHSPDISSFTSTITSNVINKIPNIDEKTLNEMIAEKSYVSFLNMVTRGLGATIEHEKDYTVLSKEKLFRKILIANRGEIALRIIRACRELGISTLVVYSKPDKDSLAVKFADKACSIGDIRGYLDIKKIIKIAKKNNVDAIHPGYGFLAENAKFAGLCEKNNIKFIGPSSKVLELMGDKLRAKEIMSKAGVRVISGTQKSLKDENEALDLAEKVGYPIILKAAAGGGGKGMRIVRSKKEMVKAYNSAQIEAQNAFGDKTLYIEKYIERPRHIEFQILSDRYGNAVHLGERECSIQRRHQKLIEEAPSPAIDRKLREKIGEISVRVVKSVGYEGAGTTEFLIDSNKDFYFMEMNTRIQVEHGITEMVTGVDLVKEQIKLAAGAKLAYTQSDIKINGWAIECRINAECPEKGFAPETGTITNYLPPGGPCIRVCSSCHTGHIISPHYDSMIAKLMCSGRTRNEAVLRMRRALDEYIIEGIHTNILFHKIVLTNKQFWRGNLSTSFIEDNDIIGQINIHKRPERKRLSRKEKILLVTTAVSNYMENRKINFYDEKPSSWAVAGRQELMNEEF